VDLPRIMPVVWEHNCPLCVHCFQDTFCSNKIAGGGRELDMDGILDGSIPGSFTLLQCRTVRIGSYKVVPKDRVLLSSVGIRIAVPAIEDGECLTAIFISLIVTGFRL
jgi:hypothetical protein